MPPFESSVEPVALPGQQVKLVPKNETYTVKAVEQMGRLGAFDFGAASANDDATENGSNIIELDDELEMGDGHLGQFWVNPLSDVEIEVRQTGQQDQRFVNSNQVGKVTMNTPANQRQVFVHENGVPHVIISNPNSHDLAKTLVYFTGFKYVLDDGRGRSSGQAGGPAVVPVDSLKQNNL